MAFTLPLTLLTSLKLCEMLPLQGPGMDCVGLWHSAHELHGEKLHKGRKDAQHEIVQMHTMYMIMYCWEPDHEQ
jgi:hypothetical protein